MAAFILGAFILLSLPLSSLSLFSPFLPPTHPSFLSAAQTLIDSNHLSMSLTIQLTSQSLLLPYSNSLTIFAPPDLDFIRFGQPPLSLLNAYFSPRRITIAEIRALPQGSTLPTLSSSAKLIVTSSFLDRELTINNVGIQEYAIFDDGSVIIYAISHFFDTSRSRIAPSSSFGGSNIEALNSLRRRGYVKMATFLDMQLGLQGWPMQGIKLTIFAPADEAIDENVVSFGNYSSLFRAHVVTGLLRWFDLIMIRDGTNLETFSEDGFRINVRKSGDLVVVNGVPVMFPDMYCGNWLIVHGLNKAIWPMEAQEMKTSLVDSGMDQTLGE